MSSKAKGARLHLRRARGREKSHWVILDTVATERYERSTGCGKSDRRGAEKALAAYIAEKHVVKVSVDERSPSEIPIADVLAIYSRDVAVKHARPHETAARIEDLLDFFGEKMLGELNGALCRAFEKRCSTDAAARRRLEDLRSAINHHRTEGLCNQIVSVVLPEKREARERWLTRSEAALLIWKCWRYREVQKGVVTDKRPRQHTAKFILLALYTGTRAALVCSAALERTEGHGWIDTDRGIFYRKPPKIRRSQGKKKSKKRAPSIRLPDRTLAHLRRWKRMGQKFAVEFRSEPVLRVTKSFNRAVVDAKLGEDVTPHTLRHTAATWMMQAKVDPWVAAGFLGMTVETLLENYGHHHPDYQEGARTAFDKMRTVGATVGAKSAA